MPSPVFNDSQRQISLSFDEGLAQRHGSLRDCMAQAIYSRGLKTVAAELDKSPGNLSVELSADTSRKFGIDELETYIQRFGDKTPIYYLIARYLGDEAAARDHALAQVQQMLQSLPNVLAAAGLPTKAPGRR